MVCFDLSHRLECQKTKIPPTSHLVVGQRCNLTAGVTAYVLRLPTLGRAHEQKQQTRTDELVWFDMLVV